MERAGQSWGKGGLERPEGREGGLSVNQLWCQFQQRPRKQLLLQTKLLTFHLDGATTIAHLKINCAAWNRSNENLVESKNPRELELYFETHC